MIFGWTRRRFGSVRIYIGIPFNAKVNAFRAQPRGVADITFFIFSLSKHLLEIEYQPKILIAPAQWPVSSFAIWRMRGISKWAFCQRSKKTKTTRVVVI